MEKLTLEAFRLMACVMFEFRRANVTVGLVTILHEKQFLIQDKVSAADDCHGGDLGTFVITCRWSAE